MEKKPTKRGKRISITNQLLDIANMTEKQSW